LRWPAPALALAAVNQSAMEVTPVVVTIVLAGDVLMVPYERWLARSAPAQARRCGCGSGRRT
jgi:hypothetical protein